MLPRLLEMGEKATPPTPRTYWEFQKDMELERERKGRKGGKENRKGRRAAGMVWEGFLVPYNFISTPHPSCSFHL